MRSQNTPTFLLHSQLSSEPHFLATLQDASTNLQQPASFLTRYIQQQATYDRTGRWETHGYAYTRTAAPGCSHKGETFRKHVNQQNDPNGTMYNPMRRLIYCINWLASKLSLQAGPRQPAHWYPTYKSPKAVTLALAVGTLVPMLPHAKPVPVATPRDTTKIPTSCPTCQAIKSDTRAKAGLL